MNLTEKGQVVVVLVELVAVVLTAVAAVLAEVILCTYCLLVSCDRPRHALEASA